MMVSKLAEPGSAMVGRMHERAERWLCLACLEAPYWRRSTGHIFFDTYPQLRLHWQEVHGVADVATSRSRWESRGSNATHLTRRIAP